MKHLTDEQISDTAGGASSPAEATHLSVCVGCASRVREFQAVLGEITSVDVPEPSPLFWQHFTQQVGESIDRPQPIRSVWRPMWIAGWATAALIVLGCVALFMLQSGPVPEQVANVRPGVDAGLPASSASVEPLDIDEDEAWAVVRSLAEDLHYDDAREAGVVPRPGAVERAATELSDAERAQLVRLLEADLGHRGNTDGE